jgi:hypothetical protein
MSSLAEWSAEDGASSNHEPLVAATNEEVEGVLEGGVSPKSFFFCFVSKIVFSLRSCRVKIR